MHKLWACCCHIILGCAFSAQASAQTAMEKREGAIIRGPISQKTIALVFTGHEFADGGEIILSELKRHNAKASFFLTGEFLDNTNFARVIHQIVSDRHYLGPHSDKHLLYCPWEGPKKTLVSREQFRDDLENNLKKIEHFGISRDHIRYFLPPFEHYNEEIVAWSAEMGMTLINYTPGTRSNADYTGEKEKNFVSSETILKSIFNREHTDPHGLNGFFLLLHIGSGPDRKDKLHQRFSEMMDRLSGDGYRFLRVDEMMGPPERVK